MKHTGHGCFVAVGHTDAGIFGYADDLVLLAPNLSSFRKLICICEKYAEEFSILFNQSGKSKLLCYKLPTSTLPCINRLETVDTPVFLLERRGIQIGVSFARASRYLFPCAFTHI